MGSHFPYRLSLIFSRLSNDPAGETVASRQERGLLPGPRRRGASTPEQGGTQEMGKKPDLFVFFVLNRFSKRLE